MCQIACVCGGVGVEWVCRDLSEMHDQGVSFAGLLCSCLLLVYLVGLFCRSLPILTGLSGHLFTCE